MKQTEVETKLIEIKSKFAARIAELRNAVNGIKEERVNLGREMAEKNKEHKRLKQQEHFFNSQIMKLEHELHEEVTQFKKEHYSQERKLSEVSDWCLVNELVSRGFYGTIRHEDKDSEFMENLQHKFQYNTTTSEL